MSSALSAASAVGAAALFAAGTALQYRVAYDVQPLAAESRVSLARSTVASPRWMLGAAALAAGLGLHALALREGTLTLVQPLLMTGVLFTLPTSRYAGGPPVTLADMRLAALLVTALAIFLVTASPAADSRRPIDATPALIAVGLSTFGVLTCVVAARRCRSSGKATLLGVGAGIALAGSAALIKVSTDVVTQGVGALLGSWELYALVAVGGCGVLLSQLAYRSGPMVASLPAINTVNPLVSVLLGTAVFDDRFRSSAGDIAIEVLSLALVLAAAAALSRRTRH